MEMQAFKRQYVVPNGLSMSKQVRSFYVSRESFKVEGSAFKKKVLTDVLHFFQ